MKPEEYWKAYGENVVGTDVLRDRLQARQAPTYQAIAHWIVARPDIEEILDVGGNVAALALFLRMEGYRGGYICLDHNPFALEIAQKQGVLTTQGNLRRLAFDDGYWHTVVVKDVIEHLESASPLREAFRVANHYVIVGTYLPWIEEAEKIEKHSDGYYANRYRFADIVALAGEYSFDLIETQNINEATGWPNQVTYWERRV